MRAGEVGRLGEDAACRYLKKHGYRILERNYRQPVGEIDIIAQKDGVLSFVEVKTRRNTNFGLPCEFVTRSKRQKLIRTASCYLLEHSFAGACAFDVVEVLHDGQRVQTLRHIPHAFTLTEQGGL